MMHSRNLRLFFIVLGVAVMLCSLAALAYALWPAELNTLQQPLAPTLFAPP